MESPEFLICLMMINQEVSKIHNLRRVAKEPGETLSADELQEMLERSASNGD